jgi:hypothetical protein
MTQAELWLQMITRTFQILHRQKMPAKIYLRLLPFLIQIQVELEVELDVMPVIMHQNLILTQTAGTTSLSNNAIISAGI